MLSPFQAVAAAARLASATIQVDLTSTGADLDAVFSFAPAADTVRFVVIRLPGQDIAVDGGTAIRENGLWRILAQPRSDGTVRIGYRVSGPMARIPLPVPSVPAGRDQGAVTLRLAGLDSTIPLAEAFPRLEWAAAGTATGRLANVPSLIQLGQAAGWPWLRLMEWGVVALVALATLGWYRRYRRLVRA
ncbi:MAG: hypothetical protein ACKVZ0_07065 [Gemmatimonadales bacterium]